MTAAEQKELRLFAVKVREGILRSTHAAKSGHPGGSLSSTEYFTYLYNKELRVDPKKPHDPERDRFVLSKGHVAPGLYATLANRGFFPVEELLTLRHIGSRLQGHPNMNLTPGVDMSTGSLGQGISTAVGMAKGAKYLKKNINVYTLLGDGELAEGQVWEATMFAAHYGLDNLCITVDVNGLQIDGATARGRIYPLWKTMLVGMARRLMMTNSLEASRNLLRFAGILRRGENGRRKEDCNA